MFLSDEVENFNLINIVSFKEVSSGENYLIFINFNVISRTLFLNAEIVRFSVGRQIDAVNAVCKLFKRAFIHSVVKMSVEEENVLILHKDIPYLLRLVTEIAGLPHFGKSVGVCKRLMADNKGRSAFGGCSLKLAVNKGKLLV